MRYIGFIFVALVFAMIVAYAIFQHSPSAFTFKNIFSGLRPSTSTYYGPGGGLLSNGSRISQAKPSAPASGSYHAPSAQPQTKQPQVNPSDIPVGFTLRDLSPYFKKIAISASPGSLNFYSQIALYGYFGEGGPVDVTGWQLRSNKGGLYIPGAVDVYDPSGLATESDIGLKNGDMLSIYSTASPVGVNLHLNKCIGYLANSNVFNPPLFLNCPSANRSDIFNLTGQCQNYILSLGSCKLPAPNLPFLVYDYSCQAFLDTVNYGGCFARHRNDYDFLSNQWVVWSGAKFLDFYHDRLLLFDKQGLLVNEYSY